MCALIALGKVRLPAALLTPRFKKLVATKQAQDNRLRCDAAPAPARVPATETPSSSPPPSMAALAANGGDHELGGGTGGGCELAGPEDAEWAAMAEAEQGERARDSGFGVDGDAVNDPAGGEGSGLGGEAPSAGDGEEEQGGSVAAAGRGHLILLCRALLTSSASRTDLVRRKAALLLADADIPGAVDALQVCVYTVVLCSSRSRLFR